MANRVGVITPFLWKFHTISIPLCQHWSSSCLWEAQHSAGVAWCVGVMNCEEQMVWEDMKAKMKASLQSIPIKRKHTFLLNAILSLRALFLGPSNDGCDPLYWSTCVCCSYIQITYLLFSSLQLFSHTLRVSQAEPVCARSLLTFMFSLHDGELHHVCGTLTIQYFQQAETYTL